MGHELSRRNFLRGASIAGAVAATGLVAAGCAPQTSSSLSATGTSAEDVTWNEEYDFVVVGSGTAIYGALAASENGGSVAVVEKASVIGGTTRLSGCAVWVPLNEHQEEEGFGADASAEELFDYVKNADIFNGSTDEEKRDYVENAAAVFRWIEENWGFRQAVYTVLGDYLSLPQAKPLGRSLIHVDDAGEFLIGDDFYRTRIEPLLEARGVQVMTDTEATSLIPGESGRIAGIAAKKGSDTVNIKAAKGVLLGAGGFERNAEMCDTFLRGPLFGASSAPGCTGDGHRMGLSVGAALGNMASVWQCPFYVVGEGLSNATDWGEYGGLPGSITVNSQGRRFMDENTAYGAFNLPFYEFDTSTSNFRNLPAFQICDAAHVELYGWPGYLEEKPEWFQEFASLEELASACGINETGLKAEVERFNGFVDRGIDQDFHRCEGPYGKTNVAGYMVERPELANPGMAKIETAPFYVARIAPGTIGSSGGLKTNLNGQVLDENGGVVEGLYACGNNSCAIFGSAYPGAGATDGPGFYRAFRAGCHAMELDLI